MCGMLLERSKGCGVQVAETAAVVKTVRLR